MIVLFMMSDVSYHEKHFSNGIADHFNFSKHLSLLTAVNILSDQTANSSATVKSLFLILGGQWDFLGIVPLKTFSWDRQAFAVENAPQKPNPNTKVLHLSPLSAHFSLGLAFPHSLLHSNPL